MCLAIPGKVICIKQDKAIIDYGEEKREAQNLIDAKVGDYVIVSLGRIAMKISEEEAMKSLSRGNSQV
jgi:hydrogenase assembly chaperone HypC/HupF